MRFLDYIKITEKYQKLGIGDYKLRTVDDVKAIYGIDISGMYGMNKPNKVHSADIFIGFLSIF